jgi:fumarate reductase subunit D
MPRWAWTGAWLLALSYFVDAVITLSFCPALLPLRGREDSVLDSVLTDTCEFFWWALIGHQTVWDGLVVAKLLLLWGLKTPHCLVPGTTRVNPKIGKGQYAIIMSVSALHWMPIQISVKFPLPWALHHRFRVRWWNHKYFVILYWHLSRLAVWKVMLPHWDRLYMITSRRQTWG